MASRAEEIRAEANRINEPWNGPNRVHCPHCTHRLPMSELTGAAVIWCRHCHRHVDVIGGGETMTAKKEEDS